MQPLGCNHLKDHMTALLLITTAWIALILSAIVINAVVDLYKEKRKAKYKEDIIANAIEKAFNRHRN
jgi:hypothetical protein